MLSAGIVDARKNEERQGVNPAPADLELLARLRLDACDSSSLMVEQYKVPIHLHTALGTSKVIFVPLSAQLQTPATHLNILDISSTQAIDEDYGISFIAPQVLFGR